MSAGLALPGLARAEGVDRLHCDAIGVRKKEQLYQCLARCERRNVWRVVRLANDADDKLVTCRSDCQDHYDEAMDQLAQRDVCGTAASEPDRCHTRMQRIGATRATCKAQCGGRSGLPADGDRNCLMACDVQCAAAVERLKTKDFCNGYANNALCMEHATDD